jgi:hypothetical protein
VSAGVKHGPVRFERLTHGQTAIPPLSAIQVANLSRLPGTVIS